MHLWRSVSLIFLSIRSFLDSQDCFFLNHEGHPTPLKLRGAGEAFVLVLGRTIFFFCSYRMIGDRIIFL